MSSKPSPLSLAAAFRLLEFDLSDRIDMLEGMGRHDLAEQCRRRLKEDQRRQTIAAELEAKDAARPPRGRRALSARRRRT